MGETLCCVRLGTALGPGMRGLGEPIQVQVCTTTLRQIFGTRTWDDGRLLVWCSCRIGADGAYTDFRMFFGMLPCLYMYVECCVEYMIPFYSYGDMYLVMHKVLCIVLSTWSIKSMCICMYVCMHHMYIHTYIRTSTTQRGNILLSRVLMVLYPSRPLATTDRLADVNCHIYTYFTLHNY